ncbi:hypothetical protein [Nocardioides aquiterrae]|uniref:WD40 repeat domain-containing protein n=1 Tax=Nocardioides aquiterrae TaxID=203799 RepID=A0ABN1UKI8_9ACTN
MTTTEIRSALTEVRDAVDVPPVDEVAFRARIRAERRRQRGGRVLAAGAAAVVVAAAAVGAARLVDTGAGREVPVASPATEVGTVSETVWFVRDGRLTALDPSGRVHVLGLHAEGVVGYTSERVYAVDAESRVVVLGRVRDDEGSGRDTSYPREDSPVPGPVQSAALSGDGRYLAWMDLQDTVTVYDLKAGQVDLRVDVPRSGYVAAVSADGVLVAENAGLVLHAATGEVAVPTPGVGGSWGAQLAGGRVLVAGPSGESSVYDVGSGTARRIAVLPGGWGALAPDGATAATIEIAPDDSATVDLWDGRGTRSLRGLDGVPEQVRFADEGTLLVQTRGGSSGLWSCSTDDGTCGALPVPDGTFRLSE